MKFPINVLCFSVIPCSVVYDGQEKSDKDFDDWWGDSNEVKLKIHSDPTNEFF